MAGQTRATFPQLTTKGRTSMASQGGGKGGGMKGGKLSGGSKMPMGTMKGGAKKTACDY